MSAVNENCTSLHSPASRIGLADRKVVRRGEGPDARGVVAVGDRHGRVTVDVGGPAVDARALGNKQAAGVVAPRHGTKAPLPSRSDTTPSQDRGDKGASSGDAHERSDGRLYPPPLRSSCRAETRPAGRGFCARDGLLAICAAFPSSGTKIRAPRSPSKPSRTNAFQRMANLRAEKFHSMTQTPEVKRRPQALEP